MRRTWIHPEKPLIVQMENKDTNLSKGLELRL